MSTPIYLDYAAATPMDDLALRTMMPFLQESFYNPSAVYQPAREVRAKLENARGIVADVLGAKDQEILFTAGGTEANNIAVRGVLSSYDDAHVVTSAIEHESVLEPAMQFDRTAVPVTKKGLLDLTRLAEAITDKTVLVSVMYANNELGSIQPIKEVAAIIASIRASRAKAGNGRPLYLHTDACQAANFLDLQVTRLGVDLMTLNGGKIYAAKQSGCLYVRTGVQLAPFTYGGGQERSIRSGTENVAANISFATMLQNNQKIRKDESHRQKQMRDALFAKLSQNIPNVQLNGDIKKRLPNNLNITIPGVEGERLLMELDQAGLLVATGSACTASNDKPSHVLLALGHSEAEANASLRITLGQPTTEQEIEQAAQILSDTINAHAKLV